MGLELFSYRIGFLLMAAVSAELVGRGLNTALSRTYRMAIISDACVLLYIIIYPRIFP